MMLAELPAFDAASTPALAALLIILGTFILEDPTALAVGLAIAAGKLRPEVGLPALFAGILLGDLGLYGIGWMIRQGLLKRKFAARWVPLEKLDALGVWLGANAVKAVAVSRFVPGMRLPTYVAAGACGSGAWRFLLAAMAAVAVWVPLVLAAAWVLGDAARDWLARGWPFFVAALAALWLMLALARRLARRQERRKLFIGLLRLTNHEFWPTWALYAPIAPWLAWLALRHRSCTLWTLANPCMPLGGIVGESKHDIMGRLPPEHALAQVFAPPLADAAARAAQLRRAVEEARFGLPFILKPDAAQRGAGVRKIKSFDELPAALAALPGPAVAQKYHPGPYEFGLFYVREPGAPRGRLFSATEKIFPSVTGDGERSLRRLIAGHPRYRLQEQTFFARFGDARLAQIPAAGEAVQLAQAGNHAQGALFLDGTPKITPALEQALDAVLSQMKGGFDFGRLDVRFSDPAAFARGEDFWIVEVNGVTSESTNLYDPRWPFWRAWRQLAAQWTVLAAIGAGRRAQGAKPPSAAHLIREVRRNKTDARISAVAD